MGRTKRARRVLSDSERRHLARRNGADGIGVWPAACFYCGAAGSIEWVAPRTVTRWASGVGRIGSRVYFVDLQIEHMIPVCRGGTNALTNLVLACEPCNRKKGRDIWLHTEAV